jgi:hypothetical protein
MHILTYVVSTIGGLIFVVGFVIACLPSFMARKFFRRVFGKAGRQP